MSCEKKEVERIEEEVEDEREREKRKREIRLHKYVGESSRSFYERGLEHERDLQEMKPQSHMLKHYFDKHSEEKIEEMEFGGRIVRQCRSAFNRQIGESVEIQNNKNHFLLNSKSEYNRCALPRLSAKLGERSLDSLEKEKKEEKEKEREMLRKIRELKVRRNKERNMGRRDEPRTKDQPALKRRKIDEKEYKRVRGEERTAQEKRKEEDPQGREKKLYPIFNTNKRQKTWTPTTPPSKDHEPEEERNAVASAIEEEAPTREEEKEEEKREEEKKEEKKEEEKKEEKLPICTRENITYGIECIPCRERGILRRYISERSRSSTS